MAIFMNWAMQIDTDMLDMAKFFTDFFADESCGKCSICREGTKRLQEILEDIMDGQGTKGHINFYKAPSPGLWSRADSL